MIVSVSQTGTQTWGATYLCNSLRLDLVDSSGVTYAALGGDKNGAETTYLQGGSTVLDIEFAYGVCTGVWQLTAGGVLVFNNKGVLAFPLPAITKITGTNGPHVDTVNLLSSIE